MHARGENLFVKTGDITVAYNDLGPETAPPVIFIHGFPFNKKIWNLQVEALKNNYRVIAYDLRGFGNTPPGNADFTIETFSDDLICFLDELGLNSVIACGLSMGGYILLNAAEKFPERFGGLILAGTQCQPDTAEAKTKRLKAIHQIQQNGTEEYTDETIKKLFSGKSFTARKEEVRSVREMISSTPVETLCKTLRALAERKETCSNLNRLTMPTLVLAGEEDAVVPAQASQFLTDQISSSSFQLIGSSGHLSNLENTHEFNDSLKKFISSLDRKKAVHEIPGHQHC